MLIELENFNMREILKIIYYAFLKLKFKRG